MNNVPVPPQQDQSEVGTSQKGNQSTPLEKQRLWKHEQLRKAPSQDRQQGYRGLRDLGSQRSAPNFPINGSRRRRPDGPHREKKKPFWIRRSLILRITPGSLTHAPQSHFSPPGFAHRCTRREPGRTFYLVNLGTPGAPPTWKHFSLLASPPFHLGPAGRPPACLLACSVETV